MTEDLLQKWYARVADYLKRKHAAERAGRAFDEPWPVMTKAEKAAQDRYYSIRK